MKKVSVISGKRLWTPLWKSFWIRTIPGTTVPWNGFVSSVYLTGPGPFLYHLYDDRGLDILGGSRELLLPLYHQFNDWILEYNLEKIDRLFAPAKE